MIQAITGEAIVARCERIRDSLRRSLFLIQNMVPPALANQVSLCGFMLLSFFNQSVQFLLLLVSEQNG